MKETESEPDLNPEQATTPAQAEESIEAEARRVAFTTPTGLLAFGFGAGLATRAPGTMGTLAAVPFAILAVWLNVSPVWFVGISFLAGIWICARATAALGVEDYGGIVWDEMVGYWLVVLFIPAHWAWWLAAFVLFRAFDILKPWPISLLDESVEGGFGIMLDDIAAAVYALLLLKFVEQILSGA